MVKYIHNKVCYARFFFLSVREPYDEMGGRKMLQIIHQKDKRALSKNLQSRKITVHP
jgi:hypothetical protein